MPQYMIQARFTAAAWEALYQSKVDRRQVLSKMLEDAGGRLIEIISPSENLTST